METERPAEPLPYQGGSGQDPAKSGRGCLAVIVMLLVIAALGTGLRACDTESSTPTTAPPSSPPTSVWPRGDRHSQLDVGEGQEPVSIDFADARTGYVLFKGYRSPQPAALFTTGDGGRTWQRLPFDVSDEKVYSLLVANPSAVVVSGPDQSFVSRDGGRTFAPSGTRGYPEDLQRPLDRRASRRCREQDAERRCLRFEVARAERFVPEQPPLRDDIEDVAEDATGTIWAVAYAQDAVFTAVSADGGTSWRLLPDLPLAHRIERTRLVSAPDGSELWLLADGVGGEVMAFVAEGTTWRPVTAGLRTGSSAAHAITAGEGVLFFAGPTAGYLDRQGGWRPTPAPRDVTGLNRLPDGTLVAAPTSRGGPGRGAWIGAGHGAERTWSYVTVEPV